MWKWDVDAFGTPVYHAVDDGDGCDGDDYMWADAADVVPFLFVVQRVRPVGLSEIDDTLLYRLSSY